MFACVHVGVYLYVCTCACGWVCACLNIHLEVRVKCRLFSSAAVHLFLSFIKIFIDKKFPQYTICLFVPFNRLYSRSDIIVTFHFRTLLSSISYTHIRYCDCISPFFFETESLTEPGAYQLSWAGSQQALGALG